MAKGIIFDIKEFTVHDGPGLRITVFLKGCPLHCSWCHNPEGMKFGPQLMVKTNQCDQCGKCFVKCDHPECQDFDRCIYSCPKGLISVAGKSVEAADLETYLKKYTDFFTEGGGGVTFSGGEPLAQPEFLLEMLRRMKPVHTAIETSGHAPASVFREAAGLADLVMMDIKHMDSEQHRKYIGVGNELIQENLAWLKASGRPFVARIPLIPGVNDSTQNLEATARVLRGSKNLQRVELLPYNPFAGAKYPWVDREYQPGFDTRQPPRDGCRIFQREGLNCILYR